VKPPTARAGRRARIGACLAVLLVGAAGACGKKGAPLAPLVRLPVAPADFAVRRQGDEVSIKLRIPAANSDGSTPAEIQRVDVYGYTASEAPGEEAILDDGTVVAAIPVRRPPEQASEGSAKVEPRPPGSMKDGFDPGDAVAVSETIGAAQREAVVPRHRKETDEAAPVAAESYPAYAPSLDAPVDVPLPLGPPRTDAVLSRYYLAVGIGHRGRKGEPAAPVRVSLLAPPAPPASVSAAYDEKTITVSWQAPPDLRRPTLAPRSDQGLLEARPLGMPSAGGTFNVYLAPARPAGGQPGAAAPAAATAGATEPKRAPVPLNATPLSAPRFQEPVPAAGPTRCYTVTTVAEAGGASLESQPSEPACITLRDTFPPPAPKGLAAVGSAGAVSLIWERTEADDLAGYLVLRAERGGEPVPLTKRPITETTFRDDTTKPGVAYTYTVVAVDRAGNRSQPSNAVEESAR